MIKRLDYKNNEWNVSRDDYGYTPYMVACVLGHENLVELFLEHYLDRNIDLNAKDNNGRTALMIASQKSIVKLIKAKLNQMEAPQKPVHQMMTRQKTNMIKAKLNQ